jgi:hypothetical protein
MIGTNVLDHWSESQVLVCSPPQLRVLVVKCKGYQLSGVSQDCGVVDRNYGSKSRDGEPSQLFEPSPR